MIHSRLPSPVDAFKPYAGRTVTVPMSGGADSTLLAAMAMRAGCNVELMRLDAQTPTATDEARLADQLFTALEAIANECKVKLTSRTKAVPHTANTFTAPFTQMAWWMSVLPSAMLRNNCVIAMGWLASDGTKTLADDFRQAIVSARRAAWLDDLEVLFPILEWTKDHVLECLSAEFPTLVPLVWWCENGADWRFYPASIPGEAFAYGTFDLYHEQCGKCHSCVDTLAYFQRWDGQRIGGNRGYAPIATPPEYLVATFPEINFRDQYQVVEAAIRIVAKRYRKSTVIDHERMITSCADRPYRLTAKHSKFRTDNRDIPSVRVVAAIMNRHDFPTHYQRAIEHLAYFALQYFEYFGDEKTAAKRLKDISLLLQSKVDELFPIPQWFLSKEQVKDEQINVPSDAVSAAN